MKKINYQREFKNVINAAQKKDKSFTPLFKVFMPQTVKEALLKTLMSGYIGQGKKVEEFEKKSLLGLAIKIFLH